MVADAFKGIDGGQILVKVDITALTVKLTVTVCCLLVPAAPGAAIVIFPV